MRAACYVGDIQVDSSVVTYFVGFQNKPLYDDTVIVSLITDPANLFDDETGIYVTGNRFRDFVANDGPINIINSVLWEANYNLRGCESERPGYIEIFDSNRNVILAENCGIRTHGNGSRTSPDKSLSIYSRVEYNGSETFDNTLFGDAIYPHKFILFTGANDHYYKIADYLIHALSSELNYTTMRFRPCVLFLDGEFWGAYYITEAYNGNYIQDHYKVSRDDVVIWKIGTIAEGKENDIVLYDQMKAFICGNDMSISANYEKVKDLIDINSFVDYYATEIYLNNGDWPHNNIAAWRSRTIKNDVDYYDGRWRWMLFDINYRAFSLDTINEDTIERILNGDGIFSSLCNNPEFVELFIERMRFLLDEVYIPERYEPLIENYLNTMPKLLYASNLRFGGKTYQDEIKIKIQDIRTFFDQRSDYIEKFIIHHFGEEYIQ